MEADIIYQFPELQIHFNVFSAVTDLDRLVKRRIDESNVYAQKNGRELRARKKVFLEMKWKLF